MKRQAPKQYRRSTQGQSYRTYSLVLNEEVMAIIGQLAAKQRRSRSEIAERLICKGLEQEDGNGKDEREG